MDRGRVVGITLRAYQKECVARVFDELEDGVTRTLYTQATGTGKTVVMAELVKRILEYTSKRVLILSHRREIITQTYQVIKDYCGLSQTEIETELARDHAKAGAKVVVGSIQTCCRENRLPDWRPDVIITDEAHRAAAPTYQKVYARFGVPEGDCLHIGCTATAKRTDRQSLYAFRPDGTQVFLQDKKTKRPVPADPNRTVYVSHCYEYSILDATEDGWLVPIRGYAVETETDLSEVETDTDGDFKEGQLQRTVDNTTRTMLAINAWKSLASDRPTLVFCAGVEHAHHAADLWQQAGFTAAALDGETEENARYETLRDFRAGRLQVLCNMGLFTEGTDVPVCAAIVHLRPTKSWNLYVQMTGRGTRTLPGVVDGIEGPQERKEAISASLKPDCLVFDLVDICENGDLCSAPSILDLPASLDLQGRSLTEAKELLEDYEAVSARVIGECPASYRDLEVRLHQVKMMLTSDAKSSEGWRATENGFRFVFVPPGYQTNLLSSGSDSFDLAVSYLGEEVLHKAGKPRPKTKFKDFLDIGSQLALEFIEEHQQRRRQAQRQAALSTPRGTLMRLSEKQIRCLKANRHTEQEIDCMPYQMARHLIEKYMAAWKARLQEQEGSGYFSGSEPA